MYEATQIGAQSTRVLSLPRYPKLFEPLLLSPRVPPCYEGPLVLSVGSHIPGAARDIPVWPHSATEDASRTGLGIC
jgi:hypothetical protein